MIFSCINFKCTSCGDNTDIYFENQFDASEVKELAICNECGSDSYCNVGDLGYRNDLSDPDYPPWQAQVIRLNVNSIYCDACYIENNDESFALKTVAWCEKCKKESMCAVVYSKANPIDLSAFLSSLR